MAAQSYTLFLGPQFSLMSGDADTEEYGHSGSVLSWKTRWDSLNAEQDFFSLANGQTVSISFPGTGPASTEIMSFIMRVVGNARLTITGKDFSGAGITSYTDCYGTDLFPGMAGLTTYKVDTITLAGLADNTTVEIMIALNVLSTDTRLL